ncbi:metal ABC transporter permease [Gottfriedia acidiceleris]|uniref:metal ABC transporter permease n=1 Tax=Gottfriedia acidiceleris TaxID=371036 RepID=UPI000B44C37E|nr:metal ABC transporter permease [Gottfriedia acidiceleris]
MSVINFFEALMTYDFLQKALLTSIIVGIICGVIGCFIVLRGMALIGDAISHAVLPGVAISYMLGFNFFIGAVVTGILTAIGIGFVSQNSRIKHDMAIGIMFTSVFAVGIILVTFMKSSADLYHILFGNVLSVRSSDMWITVCIGIVVISLVYLFYKELLVSTFDPTMAQSYGLPTKWIQYGLMVLLTLVTVASLQTVGIILVVAMLITPAATAYLLTNRLWIMIYLAASLGIFSSVIGLYFSFTYNLASGATIVLVAAFFFTIAFFFSPSQGLVWKLIKTKKNRKSISFQK